MLDRETAGAAPAADLFGAPEILARAAAWPLAPALAAPALASGPVPAAAAQELFGHLSDLPSAFPSLPAQLPPAVEEDRAKAMKELAGKFDVIPDSYSGKRLPNQVTKAEMEKLVSTYSDIRMGSSNIQFNTGEMDEDAAKDFKTKTMEDIASLLQTPSGRKLLDKVAHNSRNHTTWIGMSYDEHGKPSADAAATGRFEPTPHETDFIGQDVSLGYMPGEAVKGKYAGQPWSPLRSDVVLMHELKHALGVTEGSRAKGLVDPRSTTKDEWDEESSEYQAIGLGWFKNEELTENAYRAQRRQMGDGGAVGLRDGDEAMVQRTKSMHH